MPDPKGFLKYPRETRARRPIEERVRDSHDLYVPLTAPEVSTQATRCMDCGVPFCQSPSGCPVENFIPDWNSLVSAGHWRDALRALHATNNFPEFTGKLCPAPCESACVLGLNADPVAIREIEMSIIERGFEEGWVKPIPRKKSTGKRVAIIGSGPAGLAAAQQLARSGHGVDVFERESQVGGLLRYGIPDFKMEKHLLDRRLEQLRAEEVVFHTGVEIGMDRQLSELASTYDAVCLTIGAERPRDLPIPGRALGGIHFAMDYLREENRRVAHGVAPSIHAGGKRVLILGGGDTGSDCLGTAHRQGAAHVHQFELLPEPPRSARDPSTPWPRWPLLLRTSHAHEEGGVRKFGVSTLSFLGNEMDGVRGLRAVELDRDLAAIPGTEFDLDVDLVLLAMGFTGVNQNASGKKLGLALSPRGTIAVDGAFRTSEPRVFAAGDATRGASLIVWAIAEGRKMAASVERSFLATTTVSEKGSV